jgi:serine/threonine protein kinase
MERRHERWEREHFFRFLSISFTDFFLLSFSHQGWDMFSTGLVGNIFHIAPEQIDSQVYSGEKRDIWSLGVILYHMLIGTRERMSECQSSKCVRVRDKEGWNMVEVMAYVSIRSYAFF